VCGTEEDEGGGDSGGAAAVERMPATVERLRRRTSARVREAAWEASGRPG
jgi:hypothetical protein